MQLTPDYWIETTNQPDKVLRDPEWIAAFNQQAFDIDPHLVDLFRYPDHVNGAEVATLIRSISKPYEADLFYRDDPDERQLEEADYGRYRERMALDGIPESVEVRFGLMLTRSNMRSWPTRQPMFRSPETRDLDRFQENALFPGELVVILHESACGEWFFVRSYNYHAWIRKIRVVLGSREEVLEYAGAEHFLIVTGSKATTNFNPVDESISELQLDMGVGLPLVDEDEMPEHVDGQNPVASYAVKLPVKDDDGQLAFKTALVGRGQDVRVGYLPYTRENVIRQAFKFLGERYGWGHSYNARDCTGLVLDVYKTMGINLPRNSSQQGRSPIGDNEFLDEGDGRQVRLDALADARAGDLLYSPGHVMIFLGWDEGEPWIIHDMSGSGWVDESGEPIEGIMNGVGVTPLLTTEMAPGLTFFETLYAIKKIR